MKKLQKGRRKREEGEGEGEEEEEEDAVVRVVSKALDTYQR